jgi:hypothetical protein
MIGVTIGLGEKWKEVAEISAREMARHTGISCHVISEAPDDFSFHPSWLKLRVFDLFPGEDEILFFDADILCIRDWEPKPKIYNLRGHEIHHDAGINICNDEHSISVGQECRQFGIDGQWKYFNAGLWIAHRKHDPILKRALARGPKFGTWLEQTALTVELQSENVSVLPRQFNRLLWPGFHDYLNLHWMPDTNLHLASIGDPEIILSIYKGNGL